MHAGCSPALFYHAHRPLLSGWRDNPALPEGLVYEVTLPRNFVYTFTRVTQEKQSFKKTIHHKTVVSMCQ